VGGWLGLGGGDYVGACWPKVTIAMRVRCTVWPSGLPLLPYEPEKPGLMRCAAAGANAEPNRDGDLMLTSLEVLCVVGL
jgi:hypothetical protein